MPFSIREIKALKKVFATLSNIGNATKSALCQISLNKEKKDGRERAALQEAIAGVSLSLDAANALGTIYEPKLLEEFDERELARHLDDAVLLTSSIRADRGLYATTSRTTTERRQNIRAVRSMALPRHSTLSEPGLST